MTAKQSTVKSEARAEQGRRAIAAMERDPATGRLRKRAAAPADPAPDPRPQPAGGGAPAPALPTHGFLARHRRRSAS